MYNKAMKKLPLLVLLTVIFVFTVMGLPEQHTQTFTWDLQLLRENEAIPEFQTILLDTKQSLHLIITPVSDSYCYILIQNSERRIFLLYDQLINGGKDLYIDLLETDNTPGNKTLYIIMSKTKQTRLEDLIISFKDNPASQRYASNLHGEIARLQDRVSGLGEPSSIIIPTGGTTRGTTQMYMTRFSEKDLYVRAISIRIASTQ